MGKLKHSGDTLGSENHLWVMTFDPKLKDIEFWEPMTNRSYKLCDRIEFPDILKKYMKGEVNTLQEIQDLIKQKTAKEKVEKAKEGKKIY